MNAKLYRVPVSGSPFNAAVFVAADDMYEAYNKVVRLCPGVEFHLHGTAVVESIFVANADGRNTRLTEQASVDKALWRSS
jgi:hypothetical protein